MKIILCILQHTVGFKGLAPGMIHNYLYGIRNWFITRGPQDPLKHSNGQPFLGYQGVLPGILRNVINIMKRNSYLLQFRFHEP